MHEVDLATRLGAITYSDLSEPQPDDTKTSVERRPFSELTMLQQHWVEHGFVVLPNFMPVALREAYCRARDRTLPRDRSKKDNYWDGWHHPVPYMVCDELRDLALHRPLTEILRELIDQEMGLHLALTGWVSTERNLHQDTYLNPANLWSHYLAVWIALDDIHSDAGPFEFVPGSHRWGVLRRDRLFKLLTPEERASSHWPTFTQDWVARVCESEIARRGARLEQFVPRGGDVLIWHSNLIHRGSQPRNKQLLRKSLICHYSSIRHRSDMMDVRPSGNGSFYFHIQPPADLLSPSHGLRQSWFRRLLTRKEDVFG